MEGRALLKGWKGTRCFVQMSESHWSRAIRTSAPPVNTVPMALTPILAERDNPEGDPLGLNRVGVGVSSRRSRRGAPAADAWSQLVIARPLAGPACWAEFEGRSAGVDLRCREPSPQQALG